MMKIEVDCKQNEECYRNYGLNPTSGRGDKGTSGTK